MSSHVLDKHEKNFIEYIKNFHKDEANFIINHNISELAKKFIILTSRFLEKKENFDRALLENEIKAALEGTPDKERLHWIVVMTSVWDALSGFRISEQIVRQTFDFVYQHAHLNPNAFLLAVETLRYPHPMEALQRRLLELPLTPELILNYFLFFNELYSYEKPSLEFLNKIIDNIYKNKDKDTMRMLGDIIWRRYTEIGDTEKIFNKILSKEEDEIEKTEIKCSFFIDYPPTLIHNSIKEDIFVLFQRRPPPFSLSQMTPWSLSEAFFTPLSAFQDNPLCLGLHLGRRRRFILPEDDLALDELFRSEPLFADALLMFACSMDLEGRGEVKDIIRVADFLRKENYIYHASIISSLRLNRGNIPVAVEGFAHPSPDVLCHIIFNLPNLSKINSEKFKEFISYLLLNINAEDFIRTENKYGVSIIDRLILHRKDDFQDAIDQLSGWPIYLISKISTENSIEIIKNIVKKAIPWKYDERELNRWLCQAAKLNGHDVKDGARYWRERGAFFDKRPAILREIRQAPSGAVLNDVTMSYLVKDRSSPLHLAMGIAACLRRPALCHYDNPFRKYMTAVSLNENSLIYPLWSLFSKFNSNTNVNNLFNITQN